MEAGTGNTSSLRLRVAGLVILAVSWGWNAPALWLYRAIWREFNGLSIVAILFATSVALGSAMVMLGMVASGRPGKWVRAGVCFEIGTLVLFAQAWVLVPFYAAAFMVSAMFRDFTVAG